VEILGAGAVSRGLLLEKGFRKPASQPGDRKAHSDFGMDKYQASNSQHAARPAIVQRRGKGKRGKDSIHSERKRIRPGSKHRDIRNVALMGGRKRDQHEGNPDWQRKPLRIYREKR